MISMFVAFRLVFNQKSNRIASTDDSDDQILRIVAKKKMNEQGLFFYLTIQKLPSYRTIHQTKVFFSVKETNKLWSSN